VFHKCKNILICAVALMMRMGVAPPLLCRKMRANTDTKQAAAAACMGTTCRRTSRITRSPKPTTPESCFAFFSTRFLHLRLEKSMLVVQDDRHSTHSIRGWLGFSSVNANTSPVPAASKMGFKSSITCHDYRAVTQYVFHPIALRSLMTSA
jgi:hypothetical protein